MRRFVLVGVCGALLWTATAPMPAAHMIEKEGVQVIHPWAEASEGGAARVFPTIANSGEDEIVIIGAETPIAARVEFIVDGQPVDRVVVPGGDVLSLAEPNTHIRLSGLTDPIRDGGHFSLLLKFADGGTMALDVVVGENTIAANMSTADLSTLTVTHDPIPALGWPTMTMELALLPGANAAGLAKGDGVVFELMRGADGIYGIAKIWPTGEEPAASDTAIRAHGVLNALSAE